MEIPIRVRLNRRELLKWGGAALLGGAADLRPTAAWGQSGPVCPAGPPAPNVDFEPCAGGGAIEVMPTSPLIGGYVDSNNVVRGAAFTQELPVADPLVARPLPAGWDDPGLQDSDGHSHQILPKQLQLPEPVYYKLRVEVGQHEFTSLKVLPIGPDGRPVTPPNKDNANPRYLPASTIYCYNANDPELVRCPPRFPVPLIHARYGYPALVRFENHLHENPCSLDRGDFGDPEFGFLTHLHNGHTASESDGNPNHAPHGYGPCEYVDNLYLNWPPNNDDREKQSFLWFHDHKESHTGANVYKGLVGFYLLYDPKLDPGDERSSGSEGKALHLPGVMVRPDDPFSPKLYDLPLALFDCALDDGVTQHKDFHNGCGEMHPEWWGQLYFRHFPNHGFVGDVFTVNGVAYPVLEVKRRKYRLRFLDISIARLYRLMLMSSRPGPIAAPGRAGQYQLPDAQQCMRFTQIASEGGLLPFPIDRDAIEVSPAKRREVIVDFTRYIDGTPTTKGDSLYLVNVLQMENGGRKEEDLDGFDPGYVVPLLKIVIGDYPPEPDMSRVPLTLRELPQIDRSRFADLRRKQFKLERGGGGGGSPEDEWLINGLPFRAGFPLALPARDRPQIWTLENGGGGWTHPMHLHQEEHRVLSRNGVPTVEPPRPTVDSKGIVRPALVNGRHADDWSKEDTIALEPGEEVVIYRNFRTFSGKYVAHCHNLAHEDHNMMFGWNIV
jgi:FtsP/CotA-like multicopper oxidase with cupredoxin domain